MEALGAELRDLGEVLAVPAPPPAADVARAVRARLERLEPPERPEEAPGAARQGEWSEAREDTGGRAPGTRPVRRAARRAPSHGDAGRAPGRPAGSRRWRRWLAAGVAVVVAALFGLTPQGQAAVARVLRLAGVEVHIGEPGPLPSGVPSPLPGERRVSLREAREMVKFQVRVPAALGDPADVRVSDGGRVLSMFWPGVRLDAYDGVLDVVWRKDLTTKFPEQVTVGGAPGWWISGPHGLTYLPADRVGEEQLRRGAASTLIWQLGRTGYRLEGPAAVGEALRIAGSLR
ncbi:hypothetical protein ACFFWE_15110 [Sphaerisporangium melleum]|nr:hypothetical protein [Sphaerisporangium melleum]